MTIRRRKEDRRKDAFICSTYRKKKKNLCTEHAIKVSALEQIVLQDIRKVCSYVKQYEQEFVEDFINVKLNILNFVHLTILSL